MSPSGRSLFFLVIAMLLLVGCQEHRDQESNLSMEERTAANGEDVVTEEAEPFRPYEYEEVPKLQELIFAEGFKAYTAERPYLLGYSYEGDYLATMFYDGDQEGYIVEVTDTMTNRVTYEAFAPEAERLMKGDEVSIDLLNTAQESLDMGYRIKVPPVVHEQQDGVFEQQGSKNKGYRFRMSIGEDGSLFRIAVHDEKDRTWLVVNDRAPFEAGDQLAHHYTWAIHPQVPDRVQVMVYTTSDDQAVTPYVYTVDTSALDRRLTEQRLVETVSKWLPNGKIVYRYPSAANARSVLAVEAESEEGGPGGLLYAGRVQRFVLLDHEGEPVALADEEGVFDGEERLTDGTELFKHFELMLLPNMSTGDAELFVVDGYNEEDELVQTLEWEWSEEKNGFHLIRAEEVE